MPPSRDWPLRLQDMLEQARLVIRHTTGVDWDRFAADDILQGDVLYRIGVIGEAVAGIPDEIRKQHPDIPWRDIRNMRNVITHAYFGVDLARVWQVVVADLPALIVQLNGALPTDGGDL